MALVYLLACATAMIQLVPRHHGSLEGMVFIHGDLLPGPMHVWVEGGYLVGDQSTSPEGIALS